MLHSELKGHVLSPLEENNKGCTRKTFTHKVRELLQSVTSNDKILQSVKQKLLQCATGMTNSDS